MEFYYQLIAMKTDEFVSTTRGPDNYQSQWIDLIKAHIGPFEDIIIIEGVVCTPVFQIVMGF